MQQATDTITVQRSRAWHLEQRCLLDGSMSATRREVLAQLKAAVRSAVQARTALGFDPPPGAERWWSDYETHSLATPDGYPPAPAPEAPSRIRGLRAAS